MTARERFEALRPDQQAAVMEILGPEVAKGWIPKDADLDAAIDLVVKNHPAPRPRKSDGG